MLCCAKERSKLRSHMTPVKRLPAQRLLEFVALGLLGPSPRSSKSYVHILVISCKYRELARAIRLRSITATAVAHAFVDNWVFDYCPPTRVVSVNGAQFTAKVFKAVCRALRVRTLFSRAYNGQTNGHVERFNRSLLAGLQAYTAENRKNWHEYAGAMTYAYNTQVHGSTSHPPFDLVLPFPPGPLMLNSTCRRRTAPSGAGKGPLVKPFTPPHGLCYTEPISSTAAVQARL